MISFVLESLDSSTNQSCIVAQYNNLNWHVQMTTFKILSNKYKYKYAKSTNAKYDESCK